MQKFTEIKPPDMPPIRSNIQQYLQDLIEVLREIEKENNQYLEKLNNIILNLEK